MPIEVPIGKGSDNDRLSAVWLIVALMRLKVSPSISVPVVSDIAFTEAPSSPREPVFWPIEMQAGPLMVGAGGSEALVRTTDLEWVREHWVATARLMDHSKEFNRALGSFDGARFARTDADALLMLWGALEQLFPGRTLNSGSALPP